MFDIVEAVPSDLPEISEIYNYSILTEAANWELEPNDLAYRTKWFNDLKQQGFPILVAKKVGHSNREDGIQDGKVLGVASLGPFNTKAGYSQTVSNAIYCEKSARGMGVGRSLLEVLIVKARESGMHTMIAGIGLESKASVGLHEKLGFVEVARIKQVAFKFGRWQDLVYMQLMLNQPSNEAVV